MEISESIVPGIGLKYAFQGLRGQFSVVIKHDGSKEIYYSENGNFQVMQLSDEEARAIAMLLLESPVKIVKGESEVSFGKSILRWINVNEEKNEKIIEIDKNAIAFIRDGRIERDLNQKAKIGDIILSGE
ncbi:MAG: hypothetical protein ACP5R0_02255 [Thermoplasmata archaeon]